jgi:nucleotide-binding universal stress UspA family protein
MTFKDILVPLFGESDDAALLASVEAMQIFNEAHVAAVLVGELPDPAAVGDGLGGGAAIMAEEIEQLYAEMRARQAQLRKAMEQSALASEVHLCLGQAAVVRDRIAVQARHVDATVMTRLHRAAGVRRDVFDTVLMESGRPVMLIPEEWKARRPETVLIAWNASREAARAVADAAVLLEGAKSIVVVTIGARTSPRGHGEAPGVDIATHLARHGLPVELHNVADAADDTASAIVAQAKECNADIIVVGGFGHPRVQEAWFGGVTRTLIKSSPLPLFLSH